MTLRPLLLTALLCLTSCSVMEPGGPSEAVTVEARSIFEVQTAAERVFNEAGYRTAGSSVGTVVFERDGTKMDSVMHGNWIGGTVAQRVRLNVVEKGEGRYRVRALASMVRDPGDTAFEDDHRRFQIFSPHLSRMLRLLRRELR